MRDQVRSSNSVAGARWLALGLIAAAGLAVILAELSRTFVADEAPSTAPSVVPLERLPARPETLDDAQLAPLTPEEARRRNAAVPFAEPHPPAAPPFKFAGSALDRARATDCLAVAAMAEAGDSEAGQRAVIQVILNRVRHPAFARTICGVVFAGSERDTGCQFTFTCDGAIRRTYSDTAWAQARKRAQEALDGRVYAPVGLSTHYHTDWVYPYWSWELEKIARVESHLFFRWPGYWGSRQAMAARYSGNEQGIGALAGLASHAADDPAGDTLGEEGTTAANGAGEIIVRHPDGRAFFVRIAASASPEEALSLGRELCPSDQVNCRVMGWNDRSAIPASYPLPPASRERLTFSYVREAGGEIAFYDCKHFPGIPRDKCIPPPRRI